MRYDSAIRQCNTTSVQCDTTVQYVSAIRRQFNDFNKETEDDSQLMALCVIIYYFHELALVVRSGLRSGARQTANGRNVT